MNSSDHLLSPGCCDDPTVLRRSDRIVTTALKFPHVRTKLVHVSIQEDEQNSYYRNLLDNIALDSLGAMPIVIGKAASNAQNDSVEDRWLEWGALNGVGSSFRQLRRGAARTGVGIGIPYTMINSGHPNRLAFRIYSAVDLESPHGVLPEDRIINGIEYNEVWDPIRIYLRDRETAFMADTDPIPYDIQDILFWMKPSYEGQITPAPECSQAFMIYPSLRRYLEATVKAEEFRASIPMFLKLTDSYPVTTSAPTGSFRYEPNTIPTLPPGTEVQGLNVGTLAEDRVKMARLMVAAAARCVNMPGNLAFGDSSDHNMASAQVDIQPWERWVKTDRFDFSSVIRKAFNMWFTRGVLIPRYFEGAPPPNFAYDLTYDPMHHHPDPNKVAAADLTNLISGKNTLHDLISAKGRNPRRQMDREAGLLNITAEEYAKILLLGRTNVALDAINVNQQQTTPDDSARR